MTQIQFVFIWLTAFSYFYSAYHFHTKVFTEAARGPFQFWWDDHRYKFLVQNHCIELCPAFSNNMWLYLIYLFCRDKILEDNSRWKSCIEKPPKSQKGHLLHWKSVLWAGKREKTASAGGGCCNCQIGAGCHYCFLIISIMALQKIALFTIKYILSS